MSNDGWKEWKDLGKGLVVLAIAAWLFPMCAPACRKVGRYIGQPSPAERWGR